MTATSKSIKIYFSLLALCYLEVRCSNNSSLLRALARAVAAWHGYKQFFDTAMTVYRLCSGHLASPPLLPLAPPIATFSARQ